jgi:hypothetical protein
VWSSSIKGPKMRKRTYSVRCLPSALAIGLITQVAQGSYFEGVSHNIVSGTYSYSYPDEQQQPVSGNGPAGPSLNLDVEGPSTRIHMQTGGGFAITREAYFSFISRDTKSFIEGDGPASAAVGALAQGFFNVYTDEQHPALMLNGKLINTFSFMKYFFVGEVQPGDSITVNVSMMWLTAGGSISVPTDIFGQSLSFQRQFIFDTPGAFAESYESAILPWFAVGSYTVSSTWNASITRGPNSTGRSWVGGKDPETFSEAVLANDVADFDFDDDVDGEDFLIWQRGFGMSGQALRTNGNANNAHDFDVDAEDFAVWQTQFGGAGASVADTRIPEPSSVTLVAIVVMVSLLTGGHGRLHWQIAAVGKASAVRRSGHVPTPGATGVSPV